MVSTPDIMYSIFSLLALICFVFLLISKNNILCDEISYYTTDMWSTNYWIMFCFVWFDMLSKILSVCFCIMMKILFILCVLLLYIRSVSVLWNTKIPKKRN
eukprot:UN25672